MAPRPPVPVSVRGGSHGITAQGDEIMALARAFGGAATDTGGSSFTLHGYLFDPGLASSGLLDPVGYAEFEVDLLDALDGPHGLSWVAVQCATIDGELRAAAIAYEGADRLVTDVHDIGLGLLKLPGALAHGAEVYGATDDPVRAAEAIVASDPELADVAVHAIGLPTILATSAQALPDGHAVLRHLGVDARPVATRPPRRLTDVVRDLATRDQGSHGEIDVRILTGADGARHVIVDITGTRTGAPGPTSDITSLTTNGRALVGDPTAYEQGVLRAMSAAGVRRTDPVMLVGHSEGGLVAINAARDAVNSARFDVTHVLTAGSPIGLTAGQVPSRVQVLALENTTDVIPHLDGIQNPDRPNVTTASDAHGNGTFGNDHSVTDSYLPLAYDVQASDDPSLRDWLASAGGYFKATKVKTRTFQIQRQY